MARRQIFTDLDDSCSIVDPLQQRLRLRFLAEVSPENILDSQIKYVF